MNSRLLLAALVVLFFFGCSKFQPTYEEIDTLQSEWLLPIAKTTVGFKNIKEISNVEFDVFVSPSDLGFSSNVPLNIPSFTIPLLGPYERQLTDFVQEIRYDSLLFTIQLTNGFPFSLNAGTSVVFRNSPSNTDDSNLLFRWTLTEDAPPGGAINFTSISSDNYFNDVIYIYIENLSTSGGNNLTFSGIPITVATEFEVIDLNYVDIKTNQSLVSVDTLSISIEEPGDTFGVATGGSATVYFDNQMPANQRFQAYFLNDGIVIDSLFTSPAIINGCGVDAGGAPTSEENTSAVAPLSWSKWTKLSQSDKMVIHHYLNTNGYPGAYIRANNTCGIRLQLVADVILNVNIGEL
jgi:hypothetical protein